MSTAGGVTGPSGGRLRHSIRLIKIFLGILTVLALFYSVYFAQSLIKPLFLAALLALVLTPLVRRISQIGIPPPVSAAVILPLVLGGILAGMSPLVVPALEWANRGPEVVEQLRERFEGIRAELEQAEEITEEIENITEGEGSRSPQRVAVETPSMASRILGHTQTILVNLFLIIILAYLALAFSPSMARNVRVAINEPVKRRQFVGTVEEIQREIGLYLLTVTIINIGLGVAVAGSMALLGLPTPVLWGALAAVLNFVPFVGPIVTGAILALVSAVTFGDMSSILLPVVIFILLSGLEGYFVTPMVVGRRLTLNPLVVLVSVLLWGWLWGIVGVFLAVPFLVVLKVTLTQLGVTGPWRAMLD